MYLEFVNLLIFEIKFLLSLSLPYGNLMKIVLIRSSKRKLGIRLSSCGELLKSC